MTTVRFRAAAVQTMAKLGDVEYNLDLSERHIMEAVKQGANVVVLPECMNSGYLFDSPEHARKLAESLDGPFVSGLAAICQREGIYIASGITEWDAEQEKIFNSGVLLNGSGEIILHYQKQFLATHDQRWFDVGQKGCPVVDTELGRIGLLICFDARMPEIARCLALKGAEVLLDMANFFALDQAEMWGPARAYENGIWLVAATKAGYERSIYYPGGSMIVDPRGQVRARLAEDTHGVIVEDIFPEEARNKSIYGRNDRFEDRRPDAYSILTEPYESTPVAQSVRASLVPIESTCKVAAVQSHVTPDHDAAKVVEMISHTAKLGIQIMALPDYAFVSDWAPTSEEADRAASSADSVIAQVGEVCREYGCAVVAPQIVRENGRLYPSSVLVGPDGDILGTYRKVHLTAEEREWATAGDAFPVFDTPFGRVGMMMGYDGMFPEASRCLGVGGADMILWAANFRDPLERQWLTVPRGVDNRTALIVANRLDCPHPGGSVVVPPTGFPHWDITRMAPRNTAMGAVFTAFLDLAVARQKQVIPKVDLIANRLPETYGILVSDSHP